MSWLRWFFIAVLVLIIAILACGCATTRTQGTSVERTTGTQGGQLVELTTIRRDTSEAQTTTDLAPVIQAAVSAAVGDLRGAVKSLADAQSSSPRPATAAEVQALISSVSRESGMDPETGTALGAAGGLGLLALREFLAHRRTQRSDDEAWADIKDRAKAAKGSA